MKKLLLAFALMASVAFVGCEKNEETNEAKYTLTVSPATAKVGDEVEFTVEGENAADYQWQACYNSTTGDDEGCWGFNSSDKWTYTVNLEVGEYTVYASSKVGDLHTDKFKFTVIE